MKKRQETTRIGTAKPRETQHLTDSQKQALDLQADAEHTDGNEREALTRKIKKFGEDRIPPQP